MFEIIPNWHPMFVHFPIALLSVATGFYVLTAFMKPSELRQQFAIVARWSLWLGAGFAIVTAILGLIAYNSVKGHDIPSHAAMVEHRNWAIATLSIFLPLAAWSLWRDRTRPRVSPIFVVLMVIGFGVLASTAWHGGEVVFRYGVGVKSLPKTDGHAHGGMANMPGMADDGHAHEHEAMPPGSEQPAQVLPPAHLDDGHAHGEPENSPAMLAPNTGAAAPAAPQTHVEDGQTLEEEEHAH